MTAPDYKALGKRGGLTTAARHDMRATAAHARRSAPNNIEYFYDEVDKDRTLAKSDRDARARAAQRLYFSSLAKRRTNATNSAPATKGAAVITDPVGTSSDVLPRQ
jgi:hypothetical protein